MGHITMPPGGLHHPDHPSRIAKYCQKFAGDPLYIDVMVAGEFLCLPEGYFSPNLPSGFVEPTVDSLGPFTPTPLSDGCDVLMVYVEDGPLKTYATLIQIRTDCPAAGSKHRE